MLAAPARLQHGTHEQHCYSIGPSKRQDVQHLDLTSVEFSATVSPQSLLALKQPMYDPRPMLLALLLAAAAVAAGGGTPRRLTASAAPGIPVTAVVVSDAAKSNSSSRGADILLVVP